MERTIKVNGQSKLCVKPDKIRISVDVETLSKEYSEAMGYAGTAQREMADIVVRAGLAASECKTLSWGITAEYTYRTNGRDEQVREFVGYRYRHSFVIEFGLDHDMVGRILSEISESSLTPELRLGYFVSDPEKYKDKLLAQTVEDSRKKAEVIAQAAGVKLKQPVSIVYTSRGGEMPRGAGNQIAVPRALAAKAFDMPDITPSDIELTEAVTVEWELEG